ncbi:hypothetical protein HYALB_00009103 [Hymenoscyphus albidus]|uniref:Major facilitator superfamily (MFS) profile domain-containing protein n=1 Tax=Hymenoscyphus albidus TaxID=595503 RepID=A0A9N9LMA5_9HELO|nr:hypothetical protein HYALB_00009103 [Hymenoscyphus albidus]
MAPKSLPVEEKSAQNNNGATIQESHTGYGDGQVSRKVTGARWFIVNLAVLSATFLAKFYGQVNNKLLYLSALLIFEVGSVVIASAQSIDGLLIARAVAGLGGSGIYVGTLNILTAMTTPAERNQYLNFVGIAWSLGTILGPVVGGAFADSSATWRWAFYLNICIAGLTTPACIWTCPSCPTFIF